MAKDAIFTMKLEADLRDAFMAEAAGADRPASQIMREFMRDFVRRQREVREHDSWFRREVRKALDDPRPGIPHETVAEEARAAIDRIAARKAAETSEA